MSAKLTDSQITEGLRLAGEVVPVGFWPTDFRVWGAETAAYLSHAGTHYAAALAEVQALRVQVAIVSALPERWRQLGFVWSFGADVSENTIAESCAEQLETALRVSR